MAYATSQKDIQKAEGPDIPVEKYSVLLTGAFDRDSDYAVWRSQGSADWLLIFTLASEGRIGDGTQHRTTIPGELIICPPHHVHEYGTDPSVCRWQFLWAHFHPEPDWLNWLGQMPLWGCGWFGTLFTGEVADRVTVRLEEMHAMACQGGALQLRQAMNALEEVLLRTASRGIASSTIADRRIEEALRYIAQNYQRPLSLAEIASATDQSISRLKHVFRQQVGATVGDYIEKRRLDRAAQLLEQTTLSVKEIAGDLGFSSPFHFSARFSKQFSVSPREYRSLRSASVQ